MKKTYDTLWTNDPPPQVSAPDTDLIKLLANADYLSNTSVLI